MAVLPPCSPCFLTQWKEGRSSTVKRSLGMHFILCTLVLLLGVQ